MKKVLVLATLLAVSACGDKKSSSSMVGTASPTADLNQAKSTVEKLAIFTDSARLETALMSDAVWQGNGDWGTNNIFQSDSECVNENSPKAYMDNSLYSGCSASMFWDLMGLFRISCLAMSAVTSEANGLPAVTSSATVSINAALLSQCGIDGDPELGTMTVAVANTTDTTVYQRKATISLDGAEAYSIWFGKDGSETNMQFQDFGAMSNGGGATVGFYTYDSASTVTLFELQGRSSPNTGDVGFFMRFHQNAGTQVATALGSMGDAGAGGVPGFVRWSYQGFAGDPSSSTSSISVNMQWDNNGTTGNLSTCINPQTQVASGTTIACGTYEAPAEIATINTFLNTQTSALRSTTNSALLSKTTETATVNFTDETIHTATVQ